MTRRLRRERWGCRPERGSTFFRCERKYQRKPAARRLQRRPTSLCAVGFGLREPFGLSSTSARCAHPPGKSPLLPILTAGLAMSRAMELDSFHLRLERARARLFPPSKWAGLFPSAAYRRSAPPQLAAGKRPLAGWDASLWPEGFAAWINGLIFFSPQLAWGRLNPCGLGCFLVAWVFLPRKRPAWFHLHAGLFREP